MLDLFAGTGALGVEALSRGAAYCLFVEEDARSARHHPAQRRSVRSHAASPRSSAATPPRLVPRNNRGTFGLVFLDPPYGQGLAERALASAAGGGWLAPGAVAVIEERKGAAIALPAGFTAIDQRTWGDTQVLFARYAALST